MPSAPKPAAPPAAPARCCSRAPSPVTTRSLRWLNRRLPWAQRAKRKASVAALGFPDNGLGDSRQVDKFTGPGLMTNMYLLMRQIYYNMLLCQCQFRTKLGYITLLLHGPCKTGSRCIAAEGVQPIYVSISSHHSCKYSQIPENPPSGNGDESVDEDTVSWKVDEA